MINSINGAWILGFRPPEWMIKLRAKGKGTGSKSDLVGIKADLSYLPELWFYLFGKILDHIDLVSCGIDLTSPDHG